MNRRGILWVCAALATIAASAAVAWAASQLAGQRIGLTSEPLSVASSLAPPARTSGPSTPPAHRPRNTALTHSRTSAHPAAPARPATTAASAPPATVAPVTPASQPAPGTTTAGSATAARSTPKPKPTSSGRDDSSSDGSSGSAHSRDD